MEGYLALEDGSVFMGEFFGTNREAEGEVVFSTGMTGYQEVLTDPSYCGQIVVMTYPLIGNYGVNDQDLESFFSGVRGFVVREKSDAPSHWRMTGTLVDYLYQRGLPGLEGIDTRALTRRLREKGTMRGLLTHRREQAETFARVPRFSSSKTGTNVETSSVGEFGAPAPAATGTAVFASTGIPPANHSWLPTSGLDSSPAVFPGSRITLPWERVAQVGGLVAEVTTPLPYKIFGQGPQIVTMDFGIKKGILRALVERDCSVTVVPAWTSLGEILDLEPDGVLLSNGPGDPKDVQNGIEVARGLLGRLPLFGICLGHQILSLALGGDTYKLKYGHRGVNHPVKELTSQRVYITTQNHGYAVAPQSLTAQEVLVTHTNLNDGTVEGLAHRELPVFSVQFHPEGGPGPTETGYLFDRFLELIQGAPGRLAEATASGIRRAGT